MFSIKSFLICPPKQADTFEAYIIEHGLSEGKYMSKQEQAELLDFISNKLLLRQEKNKTKKYKTLAKAVRIYGWQLDPYSSKNSKSPMITRVFDNVTLLNFIYSSKSISVIF